MGQTSGKCLNTVTLVLPSSLYPALALNSTCQALLLAAWPKEVGHLQCLLLCSRKAGWE